MRSLAAFAVAVADQVSAATPCFLVVTPLNRRRRISARAHEAPTTEVRDDHHNDFPRARRGRLCC